MDIDLKASDKDTSDSVRDGAKDAGSGEPPLEDDVPPNFFDDFMNEDFIDGLNVVDTWDEEEIKRASKTGQKRKEKSSSTKHSRSPKRRYPRSRSPRRRNSSERRRSDSKDKDRERRDPNKTQRDILRDKDKCAKDQKAKIISEKLRVVETGLVPPGMEMEVDIIQLSSTKIENKLQKIRKSVERNRSPKLRRSPDRRRSPVRKPRTSLTRRIRSRSRSRSPHRRLERKSVEKYEVRNIDEIRRLEERRSLERRVEARRSLERRIEERREKRRRSISRSPRRRRSKSPHSDMSDRERWLRRRSRSRSRSPRRNKSFLQELNAKLSTKEKDSFLKDLKDKLNKPSEIPSQPIATPRPPHPNFIPTPVPPPQNYIPQTLVIPPQQEYDQQFFIGQPDMLGPPTFPQHMHHPLTFIPQDMGAHMIPLQPMHVPYMMEAPIPQPVPMPEYMPLAPQVQVPKPSAPLMGKETLSKLFNDKKITLSDYLSLTGKFTDESRPVNIQNKIKVISDCQDVIKELSAESKSTGRFTVRKTTKTAEKISETKHQSPFKKIPVVRFQYTTRTKPTEEKPTMALLLSKLLGKYGKEVIAEEVSKPSPIESTSTQSPPPPPPPVIYEEEKKMFMSKPLRNVFCQTDRYKCVECDDRDSKVSVHMMTQTSSVLTFDIGCQVGPDDLPKSPPKGILKNQSLAYLTPAQLLAKARGESPPPSYVKSSLEYPSEPKRPNHGTSLTDSFNENEEESYQARPGHMEEFDRYRNESERIRGPLMFERDRERLSEGRPPGRSENFNNSFRQGGQFGFQPRQWQGMDPGFNSRPEDVNPQFPLPGRLAHNQPGQYRGPDTRLNANPPGGIFGRDGRRF